MVRASVGVGSEGVGVRIQRNQTFDWKGEVVGSPVACSGKVRAYHSYPVIECGWTDDYTHVATLMSMANMQDDTSPFLQLLVDAHSALQGCCRAIRLSCVGGAGSYGILHEGWFRQGTSTQSQTL